MYISYQLVSFLFLIHIHIGPPKHVCCYLDHKSISRTFEYSFSYLLYQYPTDMLKWTYSPNITTNPLTWLARHFLRFITMVLKKFKNQFLPIDNMLCNKFLTFRVWMCTGRNFRVFKEKEPLDTCPSLRF